MRFALFAVVVAFVSIPSLPSLARSPDTFEEMYAKPTIIESSQWYALEFKIGPYVPADDNDAFKDVFKDDRGWMLGVEFDVTLLPIPYVGELNVGAGFGWSNYDAGALTDDGRAGEKTEFTIYPLSALAVLRIDTLARHAGIPVLFAGKLGYDFVRWKATTGDKTDGSGLNKGLRWGAQAALELDFFEMDSARTLDEEFGINHTFLLFEFYESMTKATGDRTFSFGLGMQF
jgi:hypothetical protein